MKQIFIPLLTIAAIASAAPLVSQPAAETTTGKPTRFVRIGLPGDNRILTLAEVEVISSGKNIAPTGKATQSSTDGDAATAKEAVVAFVDLFHSSQELLESAKSPLNISNSGRLIRLAPCARTDMMSNARWTPAALFAFSHA